ncbi:hypothetical protein FNF28_00012 [Cafeteria roenbergensis]|nr:hypothetical protein FNF28_00012 [Cafeteria roenbergensis]
MPAEKLESLQKDIEVMETSHARDASRKDGVLQELLLDMEAAEEQFTIARRSHLRALDRLVDEQDGRLASLEEWFQTRLRELETVFTTEMRELAEHHERETLEIRHLQQVLEEQQAERRREAQDDYEQRRNALQSGAMERMHQLQNVMDGQIDVLSAQFDRAHSEYIRTSDARTKAYKDLKQKDAWHTRKVEELTVRATELKRAVQRYRVKLANTSRDEEARISSMERRKADMLRHYQRMKQATRLAHQRADLRLRALSSAASDAISTLARHGAQAERIISLVEQCRALESLAEKVDPFAAVGGPPGAAGRPGRADADAGGDGAPIKPLTLEGPAAESSRETSLDSEAAVHVAEELAGLSIRASEHHDTLERTTKAATARQSIARQQWAAAAEDAALGASLLEPPSGVGGDDWEPGLAMPQSESMPGVSVDGSAPLAYFPTVTDEAGRPVGGMDSMGNFHRKLNKATMERIALQAERDSVAAENERLRELLHRFLKGISVTEDTLAERNLLMVINDHELTDAASSSVKGGTSTPVAVDGTAHLRTSLKRR